MAVVVEASAFAGAFFIFCVIIKLSIIGKELRGYLIALLFAINYDKCYYNHWNTYRSIDVFFELPPAFWSGFLFCKKTKFLYKKC